MYTEDDFIMISALQHYIYCPRQCGLIYVDDAWNENVFTARKLNIHSYKFGITGLCDFIEFKEKEHKKVVEL